jgi:hypothetical protein
MRFLFFDTSAVHPPLCLLLLLLQVNPKELKLVERIGEQQPGEAGR